MKLSEAIRLGAMLKPQAFGHYWVDGGSCAIGAACDAAGVGALGVAEFEGQFLSIYVQPCPECGIRPDSRGEYAAGFINTVMHLNDIHFWLREQIAEWIATIEAQQVAEQPDVAAVAGAQR